MKRYQPRENVVGKVIEVLPANVDSRLQRMLARDMRQIVYEMVIGLLPVDRKRSGATDCGVRECGRVRHADDRGIVATADIHQRCPQTEAVPKLSAGDWREDVRLSGSHILLLVVLKRSGAFNDLPGLAALAAVLVSNRQTIALVTSASRFCRYSPDRGSRAEFVGCSTCCRMPVHSAAPWGNGRECFAEI